MGRKEKPRRNQRKHGIKPCNPDRISELPVHLIHHILSFLPAKEVARTFFLSRRWLSVCSSIPILDFSSEDELQCEDSERRAQVAKIVDLVNGFFRHRERGTGIEKFKLCILYQRKTCQAYVDDWIDFALHSNVRELCLLFQGFERYNHSLYSVQKSVFCAKSLTVLSLEACKLKPVDYINLPSLPSLRELSLKEIVIADETFYFLFANCPSIETLHLERCSQLGKLQISSSSLRKMEIIGQNFVRKIQIISESLKSFSLDTYFERNLEEVDINTPNLLQFTYDGPPIRIFSKTPMCLSEANINVEDPAGYDAIYSARRTGKLERDYSGFNNDWFTKLKSFLHQFSYAKVLKLTCCDKALVFPEEQGDALAGTLNKLKHLEVNLTSSTKGCKSKLVNSLLLLCSSVETISINLVGNEQDYDIQHEKHFNVFCANLEVKVRDHGQIMRFYRTFTRTRQPSEYEWVPEYLH